MSEITMKCTACGRQNSATMHEKQIAVHIHIRHTANCPYHIAQHEKRVAQYIKMFGNPIKITREA